MRHPQFVEEAISKLLLNDCIQQHCEPPYCVNPLSVAEGNKLRMVIDLRDANPCLFKHSFRYEDLHCLSKVFEQNFWFFTWDLESGYHHVDIYNEHQKFLGFVWPFCGKASFLLLQSSSFWLEFRLFLLYEIAASFSLALALDEPLLLCFLRRRDLRTPREGFCVCGQFIAAEGFGAGWFEAEQREIYVRANASRSMAGLCD